MDPLGFADVLAAKKNPAAARRKRALFDADLTPAGTVRLSLFGGTGSDVAIWVDLDRILAERLQSRLALLAKQP